MIRKEELKEEISKIKLTLEPLEKELTEIYKQEEVLISKKIQDCYSLKDKFIEDDLRYAARDRCPCGAGMAYPKNIGINGGWHCSDILLGRASVEDTHDPELPFAFYDIKSADQPSANGATTKIKKSNL
jgi:hypothetical protein